MNVYIWLIGLTLFQILDGLTTYLLFNVGIGYEMNPVVNYALNQFGPFYGLIIPKFITMVIAFSLIPYIWYSKFTRTVFKTVVCIYFYVGCSNLYNLISLGVCDANL